MPIVSIVDIPFIQLDSFALFSMDLATLPLNLTLYTHHCPLYAHYYTHHYLYC